MRPAIAYCSRVHLLVRPAIDPPLREPSTDRVCASTVLCRSPHPQSIDEFLPITGLRLLLSPRLLGASLPKLIKQNTRLPICPHLAAIGEPAFAFLPSGIAHAGAFSRVSSRTGRGKTTGRTGTSTGTINGLPCRWGSCVVRLTGARVPSFNEPCPTKYIISPDLQVRTQAFLGERRSTRSSAPTLNLSYRGFFLAAVFRVDRMTCLRITHPLQCHRVSEPDPRPAVLYL